MLRMRVDSRRQRAISAGISDELQTVRVQISRDAQEGSFIELLAHRLSLKFCASTGGLRCHLLTE
jgi:hypothetical protein